jgi:hypothetical protein
METVTVALIFLVSVVCAVVQFLKISSRRDYIVVVLFVVNAVLALGLIVLGSK